MSLVTRQQLAAHNSVTVTFSRRVWRMTVGYGESDGVAECYCRRIGQCVDILLAFDRAHDANVEVTNAGSQRIAIKSQ